MKLRQDSPILTAEAGGLDRKLERGWGERVSLGEAQLEMQLDSTGKVVKVFGQDVTRGRGAIACWRGPVCWDCFAYLFFFFFYFFFSFILFLVKSM